MHRMKLLFMIGGNAINMIMGHIIKGSSHQRN